MNRRDFLFRGVCAGGLLGVGGVLGCQSPQTAHVGPDKPVLPGAAQAATPQAATGAKMGANRVLESPPEGPHAAIASKRPRGDLVNAAVEAFGGPDAIFKPGDRVVIKPNLAWGRAPEIGANTHPEVLGSVIQLAKQARAAEILVVEHSCDKSMVTFEMSGAQQVCEDMRVPLISLDKESMYDEQAIPGGVNIQRDMIARELLECDVYINLPCLKHHGATKATVGMKNQMGANWDRQHYHRFGRQSGGQSNLHQNIADLATALRPTLVIVDATRALKTNGPKGPGQLDETNAVIVSHDIVTADALGAQMLGIEPGDVEHITLAATAGVGEADLEGLQIARV